MFKLFVWVLSIITSAAALASAAMYYISYGLFAPHSNIAYSGSAFFWWKALLASSFLGFGLFFVHGYLAGRALWRKDYAGSARISLMMLVVLGFLLFVNLLAGEKI